MTRSGHRAHDQTHVDANFSSQPVYQLHSSLHVGRPNHLAPLSSGSFTMDDSASSLGPVTIEPDSLASHTSLPHCREVLAALPLEIWRSRKCRRAPFWRGPSEIASV